MDIEIRAGDFGNGLWRKRARVTQYAALPAVSYEEHLGRLGSDFHIDMADGVKIVVGPMLVRSPHVLYTNVVEALLRFVLVSRGYMLLHSACLELDGRGVMLSALTDTGKTGTILRLLRENGSRFLSDDMTIIDSQGVALCYPKPLTISQHTLRAVNAGDLTRKEWRRLRVQSRLHSKQGRGIGTELGRMNVPIMTLNALTQYVVPPPKYVVDRLVPCNDHQRVKVEELFIIERKPFGLFDIDPVHPGRRADREHRRRIRLPAVPLLRACSGDRRQRLRGAAGTRTPHPGQRTVRHPGTTSCDAGLRLGRPHPGTRTTGCIREPGAGPHERLHGPSFPSPRAEPAHSAFGVT